MDDAYPGHAGQQGVVQELEDEPDGVIDGIPVQIDHARGARLDGVMSASGGDVPPLAARPMVRAALELAAAGDDVVSVDVDKIALAIAYLADDSFADAQGEYMNRIIRSETTHGVCNLLFLRRLLEWPGRDSDAP